MQRPLEIRFRQMDSSPAIEARIRKKAAEPSASPIGSPAAG